MTTRVLAGRYELVEPVGSGGMATVWRALDRSLGRMVAVKVLHENLAAHTAFVERFRLEARHAAALSHPNVVAVYDSGLADGVPFIVMELVEGRSLHRILREDGPLRPAAVVQVGLGLVAALGHAHARGLVHRDVKPGNVLISREGWVKVTDFGIAKAVAETTGLTQTGTVLGTASYLSPEQAAGRPATPASDLYAVGCVLYEALAGHPPFVADNPVAVALAHQRTPVPPLRGLRPDVPPSLEAVILRALAKDPAERFQSAGQMGRALAATGLGGDEADALGGGEAATARLGGGEAATARLGGGEAAAAPPGGGEADMAPAAAQAAATQRASGQDPTRLLRPAATEVLATRRPPRPAAAARILAWAGILLAALAAAWLAATLLSTRRPAPTPAPTPLPTRPLPTPRPTPRPTTPPTASPTPSPQPTETPAPTPASPRTPKHPRLPGVPTPLPTPPDSETASP